MITRIGLKCPDCQRNLSGQNDTIIFLCNYCKVCFEISEGKVNKHTLEFIKPHILKDHPLRYLPFWRIRLQLKNSGQGNNPMDLTNRDFHIPAFFIKNITHFGDIGYVYQIKSPPFIEDKPRDIPVHPASRSIAVARQFPELYLTKMAAETEQQINVEVSTHPTENTLSLIPFYEIGEEYYDSLLFFKYPVSILL